MLQPQFFPGSTLLDLQRLPHSAIFVGKTGFDLPCVVLSDACLPTGGA